MPYSCTRQAMANDDEEDEEEVEEGICDRREGKERSESSAAEE